MKIKLIAPIITLILFISLSGCITKLGELEDINSYVVHDANSGSIYITTILDFNGFDLNNLKGIFDYDTNKFGIDLNTSGKIETDEGYICKAATCYELDKWAKTSDTNASLNLKISILDTNTFDKDGNTIIVNGVGTLNNTIDQNLQKAASPEFKKVTINNASANGIDFLNQNAQINGNGGDLICTATNDIHLRPTNGYKVIIDSGNGLTVGVGTTQSKLNFYDTGTNNKFGIGIETIDDGQMSFKIPSAQTTSFGFGTIDSGNGTTWSEKVRIQNDGKVGIGTTKPTNELTVNGDTNTNCLILSDNNKFCNYIDMNVPNISGLAKTTDVNATDALKANILDVNGADGLRYTKTDTNSNFVSYYKPAVILGDVNVSTKTNNGITIHSDENTICVGANTHCIDWNGTVWSFS